MVVLKWRRVDLKLAFAASLAFSRVCSIAAARLSWLSRRSQTKPPREQALQRCRQNFVATKTVIPPSFCDVVGIFVIVVVVDEKSSNLEMILCVDAIVNAWGKDDGAEGELQACCTASKKCASEFPPSGFNLIDLWHMSKASSMRYDHERRPRDYCKLRVSRGSAILGNERCLGFVKALSL